MFATHGYIVIAAEEKGVRIPCKYYDQAVILTGIVGGKIVYNVGGKG